MKNINETMSKYTDGEITMDQANEELKAAGAGFHLVHMTDEERAAKKQREDYPTVEVGGTAES